MANRIVSSPYWDSESTPTIHQILHASEEVWRELALLADADPIYCERLRARPAGSCDEVRGPPAHFQG